MNLKAVSHDPVSTDAAAFDAVRARILEQVSRERSPTRAEVAAKHRVLTVAMLGVPLLVFLASGGVRMDPRPGVLVIATALGACVLALGAALIAIDRGGSMLGRPRAHLVAVALVTPILLLSWKTLASSRYPEMMAAWPARPGLRCALLATVLPLAPLLGLLWMRRRSDPIHPRATAAAFGTAAGAGAWVLVDVWCPVSYVPHLLLGHVLPLILTIVASAAFGGRLVRLRSR